MTPTSENLMRAVGAGDLEVVRSLVESGADVNATDEHGSGTLLNFHPGITAYLLSKGAAPNAQTNENGASVLAGLCFTNQTECVRLLLAHGADPNRGRDESMETPLHHALAGGADIEVIRLLIDAGANTNAKTKPGIYSYNSTEVRRRVAKLPFIARLLSRPLMSCSYCCRQAPTEPCKTSTARHRIFGRVGIDKKKSW